MIWVDVLALVAFVEAARAFDLASNLISPLKFSRASYGQSAGGNATCVSGQLQVTATAINTRLLLQSPKSQQELTQTLLDMAQAPQAEYMARVTAGGPNQISGNFSIYGKLCVPNDPTALANLKTLQFLNHGGTLDHTYWDFAPDYSYVDAAAAAGYATFNYDRLGYGLSDHPDPNQVVQAALQVEIAHAIISGIRAIRIGTQGIQSVVGVGHSAGSSLALGIVGKYPRDFDALIFTGISASTASIFPAQIAFGLEPAALDPSGRFEGLDYGYLTQGNISSTFQFPFYHFPQYDPNIFQTQFNTRQTTVFGELLTFGSTVAPQPSYAGPVDVVLGQYDYIFCTANCSYPTDQAEAFVSALFPGVTHKATFLQPGSGHLVAQHYSARQGFTHSLDFLKANGL